MIKIIARGKPESEKFYQLTCGQCGCIFAFQRADVNYEDRPCGDGYVDCPQTGCQNFIVPNYATPIDPENLPVKTQK